MDFLGKPILALRVYINGCCAGKEPWQIVTITTTTVLATVWMWQFIFQEESIPVRARSFFFRLVKKIPAVKKKLKNETDVLSNKFCKNVEKRVKGVPYVTGLPTTGWSNQEVLSYMEKCLALGDYDWKNGHVSGTVYYHKQELIDLISNVYSQTSFTNPLHSDIFPGISKMEAEVVRMTANLFHGGPNACGTMTSGGTESILMACKALRDCAFHERGICRGEIILPKTAHPAFDKAGLYFGMKITHIPVDTTTFMVDVRKMERAISKNTVMLVGSVPNFPYGTADDIEAITALGRKYNIPVHVDCCLGGFLTAFMPAVGFQISPFDFALSGVVSLSVDTHKYGFTPKGSSVILYAEEKYRHHQYTVTTDWPGGVYGSPTVNGSRPGSSIAVTWATIVHFGFEGYKEATRKIVSTTKYLEEKLREIDELYIFGKPATSVVAFSSKKFHIYKLSEILVEKWNINVLQFPPAIHLCVTHMHTADGVIDSFISDIKTGIQKVLESPDPQDASKGEMAVYGLAQSIPDRTIVGDITRLFIDSLYFTPKQEHCNTQNGHI